MASFSVDITEVRFAATNTGYKDITITGMPQAGVSCTITGTDASSFGFRIPGDDQNVYRVYTTSNTSIGTSVNKKTATFKITNLSDSTDYVNVSLVQVAYPGYPRLRGVKNVYDNIYAYYASETSVSADIFAEYRTDNVGTYVILLVDGYEGTTTISGSGSWAYYTEESAYTDTGFKQIKIGATNNYDSVFRLCRITFPGTVDTFGTSKLYQNAYPSSTAGCTSPITFSGSGGTKRITLNTDGESAGNIDYLDVYTNDGLTYTIVETGSGTLYYDVTTGQNTSDKILRGAILFVKENIGNPVGFTIVKQDPSSGPVPTLTVDPAVLDYPASGGARVLDVTYATSLSTNESSFPDWLSSTYVSIAQGSGQYTITAASNTSTSSRSFNFELADVNMSLAVPITQAGGDPASLSISPTSNSVSSSSGSVQITVTSSGISNVQYSISDSWITYGSKSGNVYTFNYAAKTSTGQRTGTITFYGGGLSKTYTLIQAGASQIVVSPTSEEVSSSSGTVSVSASGASNISYSISGNWLTYSSKSGSTYVFAYSENTTGSSRTATVTFSAPDAISGTYTITQAAAEVVSLVISPTSNSVSSSSGTVQITVTSSGISNVQYSISDSWITYGSKSGNVYTFNYTANGTSSARQGTITFSGGGLTRTFTLSQAATDQIVVSPTSSSVGNSSGSVQVTVTGAGNISYNISGSWLSYSSKSGNVYTFTYPANTGSSSRTATVTFSATGVGSATYTLTQQAGVSPVDPRSLKVYPSKLRYYGEGGSKKVSFTNRPDGSIGYEITYIDGSGWLSITDYGPAKYVTASENSGIRRRASIRFYDVNNRSNYVIVQVIQGNIDGYDSIWMDNLFYPDYGDENKNYYYRITNQNNGIDYFVGVAVQPIGWGGEIGGIDVPRLVEDHLGSSFYTSNAEWLDMSGSYCTVDVYNMTEGGYPGVVDATFKYWNDWSRFERRYDYTRSLNDPINGKGCDNMIIPFCVYYDDAATFSIVDTEKNGNVNTYTLSSPSSPFAMHNDSFYDTKKLEFKQDDEVIFSYDMDHCGPGAFIYRNRFGGWDSFLIEGNISKTDNYTKLNWRRKGEFNQIYTINSLKYIDEKVTDSVNINTTFEVYTGWLSDEEAERLVFHLLSSPIVYFQNLHKENQVFDTDPLFDLMPIRITASSAEYKKFRNGKRLVNYLITFEKGNIEKVRR